MNSILISILLTNLIFGFNQSRDLLEVNPSALPHSEIIKFINIPTRSESAITGSEFVKEVAGKSVIEREKAVVREILLGNVPSFSRKLKPLIINQTINSKNYETLIFVSCDYMAIGSDDDYLYIPMTPSTAQYLADVFNCSLPTKKSVDLIYSHAEIKLKPQPIPPSNKMTTIPVFDDHTDSIKQQISEINFDRADDNLIAGHKKDIIISNKIYSTDRDFDRVVIYGWHLGINNPIQPVYNGHIASYADYSHGVRFISNEVIVNDDTTNITNVLKDPTLSLLLSSEGVIEKPFYPNSKIFTSMNDFKNDSRIGFILNQNYPNPFNPVTSITYSISNDGNVTLSIYDVLGNEVDVLDNGFRKAGNYSHTFNAGNLTSGIYFYTIRLNDFIQTKKMLLMK